VDEDIRLYAVLRSDISMSRGKAIAQAGHAYLETYLDATQRAPEIAAAYAALAPGTKIALDGGDPTSLQSIYDACRDMGIPCRMVIDRDHIELPHFDGSPILTALGVGPIDRTSARRLLGRLPLWRGKGGGS
jgi:peptidyl-tRNA hydrolase